MSTLFKQLLCLHLKMGTRSLKWNRLPIALCSKIVTRVYNCKIEFNTDSIPSSKEKRMDAKHSVYTFVSTRFNLLM